MKNSKLITAGILVLAFLFIHNMQSKILEQVNAERWRTPTYGSTIFTEGIVQVEKAVFASAMVAVNKGLLAIEKLLVPVVYGVALQSKDCTVKRMETFAPILPIPPQPIGNFPYHRMDYGTVMPVLSIPVFPVSAS